ncbi:hypothetical protein MKX03_025656 [Papaver bracteatum]|nr:hypothetical protein MKX03_025656 [Papaver bracteatum]
MGDIKKFLTKKTVISLALGQFVSLLITSTGFSSSELARKGINAPTSQSFANYVLLAIVYGGIRIYQKKKLQTKWYYYLLLALFDVEGNFLVVKAYQYTSLTSVIFAGLPDDPPCHIIYMVILEDQIQDPKVYWCGGLSVAGLVLVVFSDVHAADRAGGSHPIKGDLLVIAGQHSMVLQIPVKYVLEVMAMLGLFESYHQSNPNVSIISLIFYTVISHKAILERNELKAIHWSAGALLPYSGFAAAMFLFYSTVPILLQISGSTMLNLSLLTSDMWAVLIRIFAYHEKVDWMYFIAFAGVVVGLIIYSGGSKEEENKTQVAAAGQSTVIDEEAGVRDQNQGSSALKV